MPIVMQCCGNMKEDKKMTVQFLSETETESTTTTHCCVCNSLYNEKEIGWVYSTQYKVYTCSNECYTSNKYEMLLIEGKK